MVVKEYGNVIIIGNKGKNEGKPIEECAEAYVFAILKSLQPFNYEKYGDVKIQFTPEKASLVEYILSFFKGLWVMEDDRQWKKITVSPPDGKPYELDIIEIVLKLHPKLRR